MKTIIREGWSSDADQEKVKMEISWGRQKQIESEICKLFPEDVNARFYFDCSLSSTLLMWITITPDFDSDGKAINPDPLETSALKMMASAYTGEQGEKNIRAESGIVYWAYRKKCNDTNGDFEFWLLIENAHPMNCKIEKVTEEVERFKITC